MGLSPLRFLLISILLHLSFCQASEQQSESTQQKEKVYRTKQQQQKLAQKKKMMEARIYQTNFQTYNFKLSKGSEFILKPEEDQVVRAAFDIYWNQMGVYMPAEIIEGEEVELRVQVNSSYNPVASDSFLTATGVTFNASRGSTYHILLKEKGSKEKIIMMRISQTVSPSNRTAKKDAMQKIEQKLSLAEQKIKNGLVASAEGAMIESKITNKILRQSTSFGHFQILQAVFVVLVSCLEVKLVTKLLRADIVV